jgi:hypothetical protein
METETEAVTAKLLPLPPLLVPVQGKGHWVP